MANLFFPTTSNVISGLFVATYGIAPGSTYLGQATSLGAAATAQILINATGATTSAALAARVMGYLGVTTAMDTGGVLLGYLTTSVFANVATSGQNLVNLVTAWPLLGNGAYGAAAQTTYGTAADAFATQTNAASAYSSVAANNSTDLAVLAAVVGTPGVVSGTTFSLTTGTDTFTGGNGADTFNGLSAASVAAATDTLTASDIINGGAGIDTLNITTTAANTDVTHAALISNIEIVSIRNTAATTVASLYAAGAGVTTVNSNLSTGDVTISNLATGATVGYNGNNSVVNGALSATYVAAATAATLNIAGGTTLAAGTTGNVVIVGAGLTSAVINSTGLANTIGTLGLPGTVTALTINATTDLTTGALTATALTTLTTTGAGAVDISAAALAATVTQVTSGAGGVSFLSGAAATAFTGGAGNDTVNLGALVQTATITGGTGTDTVVIGALGGGSTQLTSATAAKITGFETLSVVGGATTQTYDVSLLTGITSLKVAAATADVFSNLTAAQAGAVTISGSQTTSTTFNVTGATTVGQLDTLSVAINDGATAVNTITLPLLVAAGVETINFAMTDNLTVTTLVAGLTAFTKIAATGAGNLSLTTGTLALNVNSVIDASAATGTVLINATGSTANGISIKGSLTGVNTLTGNALADVIVGGAANDTITGLAGNNTLTGGGGSDSFVIASSGVLPSSASFITITDYSKVANTATVSTFDTISAATLIAGTQGNAAGTGVATVTSSVATFNAADTTFAQHLAAVAASQATATGATTIWQEGADSYIYISDGTGAVATTDTLIKLVGVTCGSLTIAGNAITGMA